MAYLNEGKATRQGSECLPEIHFKGEETEIVAEDMGKLGHHFVALSVEEGMREKMTFKNGAYSFMLPFS